MTTVPQPADLANTYACTYDLPTRPAPAGQAGAWNRLIEVKGGTVVVAKFEYDGLNRRVKKFINTGEDASYDEWQHFYYNTGWQLLETRKSTDEEDTAPDTLQPEYQYVWSKRYIDAPVLRDENKDDDDDCTNGSDERLYYLTDANMNVTCLTDTGGDAVERYRYDPYGRVTIYTGGWGSRSSSSYDNSILYAGYYRDVETELYHVRNRFYHSPLGRWLQRDPIGYAGGMSLYEYTGSNPVARLDPAGLEWKIKRKNWKDRATVEGDCDDTIDDLAKKINMEPSKFRRWLRAKDGKRLPKKASDRIKSRRKFTIPNKIFVGVGKMYSSARMFTGRTPKRVYDILDAKGFNVTYRDWNSGFQYTRIGGTHSFQIEPGDRWTSDDIPNDSDLYGLVYFGHGYGRWGKLSGVFASQDPMTGVLDIGNGTAGYHGPGLAYDGQFGVLILKSCYAKQGGWGKKASSTAHAAVAVWLGDGVEAMGFDSGILEAARNAK